LGSSSNIDTAVVMIDPNTTVTVWPVMPVNGCAVKPVASGRRKCLTRSTVGWDPPRNFAAQGRMAT